MLQQERSTSMSVDFWSMSCIAVVCGSLLAVTAQILQYIAKSKEQYLGHAEGRVVGFITEPRNDTYAFSQFHNRQAAVFEFFADGKLIKGKDPGEVYPSPYQINQKLKILYDPSDPQKFCVADRNPWMLAAKLAKAAAICLIVAACAFFLMYAARLEL